MFASVSSPSLVATSSLLARSTIKIASSLYRDMGFGRMYRWGGYSHLMYFQLANLVTITGNSLQQATFDISIKMGY